MDAVNRAIRHVHQDTYLAPRVIVDVAVSQQHLFICIGDLIDGAVDCALQTDEPGNLLAEFLLHVDDFADAANKGWVSIAGVVNTLSKVAAGNTGCKSTKIINLRK